MSEAVLEVSDLGKSFGDFKLYVALGRADHKAFSDTFDRFGGNVHRYTFCGFRRLVAFDQPDSQCPGDYANSSVAGV